MGPAPLARQQQSPAGRAAEREPVEPAPLNWPPVAPTRTSRQTQSQSSGPKPKRNRQSSSSSCGQSHLHKSAPCVRSRAEGRGELSVYRAPILASIKQNTNRPQSSPPDRGGRGQLSTQAAIWALRPEGGARTDCGRVCARAVGVAPGLSLAQVGGRTALNWALGARSEESRASKQFAAPFCSAAATYAALLQPAGRWTVRRRWHSSH